MANVHTKLTIVKLGAADISTFSNESEFVRKADVHDKTCYGADDHVYHGGLGDSTFKVGGLYDNTATTGSRNVIEPLIGTTVVLTRQLEGAGSGKPQDVVDMVVTSYTESSPVADMIKWSMEGQCSGAVNSAVQAP